MNLILLHPHEVEAARRGEPVTWPATDERARHVREVLRTGLGECVLVGVPGGKRLWARRVAASESRGAVTLAVELESAAAEAGPSPAPLPVTLLVGLARPQTMRKVLVEATALGVTAFHVARTELSERSYATAKLWTEPGEPWRRLVAQGAEQARSTYLPTVTHHRFVGEALAALAATDSAASTSRVALELPEGSEGRLATFEPPAAAHRAVLAVGAERGFTEREQAWLREAGFQLRSLGERPLRTETACVAGVTLLAARHGWL